MIQIRIRGGVIWDTPIEDYSRVYFVRRKRHYVPFVAYVMTRDLTIYDMDKRAKSPGRQYGAFLLTHDDRVAYYPREAFLCMFTWIMGLPKDIEVYRDGLNRDQRRNK